MNEDEWELVDPGDYPDEIPCIECEEEGYDGVAKQDFALGTGYKCTTCYAVYPLEAAEDVQQTSEEGDTRG